GPRRKIKRRETDLSGNRRAAIAPPQAPGDHQVNYEKQIPIQLEYDALADAPKRYDRATFRRADRRLRRAHEKRIRNTQAFERLLQHPRRKRLEVKGDIRKFGHGTMNH